ncbi:MAG: potassium transporter Kup [Ardenticatenia bacterium]|nr:potassium transporter Kup [Ardenticatenia bacterium]
MRYRAVLALSALGVVFGDIGTSPLYALRECFHGPHALPATHENVLGVLSLVTWALILLISVKYLVFILRADNHGEGGILAMAALLLPSRGQLSGKGWVVLLLGLFGAALLYGDGMITPAISVLSAVEGLKVAAPGLAPFVLPITIVILVGLFLVQSRGTAAVGRLFGPVTFVWFAVLALMGLPHLLRTPQVLAAINPLHALQLFQTNGMLAFFAMGAVFLVVTGGEALYADMGHFGPGPIRLGWFGFVLPALFIHYMGQGALIMSRPVMPENPFFEMVPSWAVVPLVVLAAAATVIASQALISGAFSLTMQAIQLGYCPRMAIRHTSAQERGQIYIPAVNWALMVACISLVLSFGSSSRLAAAYGIAVSTLMVITSLLFALVLRRIWHWPIWVVALVTTVFLVLDLTFFAANALKFLQGGWLPLLVALAGLILMATWKQGRQILASHLLVGAVPLKQTLDDAVAQGIRRVPGTAAFLYSNPRGTPPALRRNLDFNQVLHERSLFITIQTAETPRVSDGDRLVVEDLGHGCHRVIIGYGFMEQPDLPAILPSIAERLASGPLDASRISYFLGRELIRATEGAGMALWREKLFSLMMHNARPAASYFGLPPERVVEIGATWTSSRLLGRPGSKWSAAAL